MNGITGKNVLVTGGSGFLGYHVVKELLKRDVFGISVPSHYSYDLTKKSAVKNMLEEYNPDTVIHLAAVCGGIGANQAEPGRFFYENLMMGLNMMEQSRLHGVEKFVQVGTVCSYPKFCPVPFKEEDIWNGYPEETNAPYGIAKKALLTMAQAYRQQYGFNAIYLIPVNLYGPRDNFDPSSSHVIPALIRKMLDAKKAGQTNIPIWGSGLPTREFLYVKNAAEGIVMAAEKYDKADPVNLGSGLEITIKYLVDAVAYVTGYDGETTYDLTKPDGQPKRRLDVSKAWEEFSFKAKTPFIQGLKETVEWYENSHSNFLV